MKAPEKYPTTDSSDPKDILCKAADIIEEFGWTRGNYQNDSRVCVMGAINAAVTGEPNVSGYSDDYFNKTNRAVQLLSMRIQRGIITHWNDKEATKKEVIKKLRGDGC